MDKRKILALSSSRVGAGGYLEAAIPLIKEFLGPRPLKIAFIPFAFVDADTSPLIKMLTGALEGLPYSVNAVTPGNAKDILANADAIIVSGGNTFKLLHDIYDLEVMEIIRERIGAGVPYIGWSAGSNITGATICTTNDMPIIEPRSFTALGFFPFQINPHYYNIDIPGFNGETRDQRLAEFIKLNPAVPVVCLPEGTALLCSNGKLLFTGNVNGVLMRHTGNIPVTPGDDMSYLL